MLDKFSDEFYLRFSNFGRLPLCNQRADRAPRIFGFTFPICWRCFSIFLGLKLLGPVTFSLFEIYPFTIIQKGIIIVILLTPALIDGVNQYYFQKKESTNFLRILTGLLAGVGLFLFIEGFKIYFI